MDYEKRRYKRPEAFEMGIWGRVEKISWTEQITNLEVLTMIGDEGDLIDTMRKRQRKWIGHRLRGGLLL